ncbi:hypothetical protein HDV00_004284 [Rhizophlyctis rosea]|nr:hypothetical protein HDV00_004284 [Rhizophlyctis rosea]
MLTATHTLFRLLDTHTLSIIPFPFPSRSLHPYCAWSHVWDTKSYTHSQLGLIRDLLCVPQTEEDEGMWDVTKQEVISIMHRIFIDAAVVLITCMGQRACTVDMSKALDTRAVEDQQARRTDFIFCDIDSGTVQGRNLHPSARAVHGADDSGLGRKL